jgi:hypothetical protein
MKMSKMSTNYPYRAKACKPADPMWGKTGPEYGSNWEMGTTKSPHRPKPLSAAGSMVDGPYGGKKPQS